MSVESKSKIVTMFLFLFPASAFASVSISCLPFWQTDFLSYPANAVCGSTTADASWGHTLEFLSLSRGGLACFL